MGFTGGPEMQDEFKSDIISLWNSWRKLYTLLTNKLFEIDFSRDTMAMKEIQKFM